MGKLLFGPYGPITGTVGNLTQYMLNGQNVIRAKRTVFAPPTIRQQANQQRMTVVNGFLHRMLPYLKVGFSKLADGTTKNYHNLATSYNKKEALKGEYPNIEMDYEKAKISIGELLEAQNPVVEAIQNGLKFTWDPANPNHGHGGDQVMIVAFGTVSKKSYGILYGPLRSVGEAQFKFPNSMEEEPFETYMSFISPDRLSVSNSVYVGKVDYHPG